MPLSKENIEILNNLSDGISDIAQRVAKNAYEKSVESVREFQRLHNNILLLAVTISGVVVPLILNKTNLKYTDLFLVSTTLFGLTVIFGVVMLAYDISNEPKGFSIESEKIRDLVTKIQTELQRIRLMETDATVGEKIEELRGMYNEDLDAMKGKKNLWARYKDAIFYGLFTTAFIILLIGLILNI